MKPGLNLFKHFLRACHVNSTPSKIPFSHDVCKLHSFYSAICVWGALVKISKTTLLDISHWWYFEFCIFHEWFNTDLIYESINQIRSRAADDVHLIALSYPSLQQSLKTAGFSGTEPSDSVKMFSIFPASVTSAASETDFLLAVQREMRWVTACYCQWCQTLQKRFTKCVTRH